MTAVWYIGGADVRSISSAEWTAAGITGTPSAVVWNAANGWSVAAAGFTAPQLALLAADGSFNTAAADGPRTGATIPPVVPSQLPATQGYVDSKVGPTVAGWAPATGTKSKATFVTTSVTLPGLAAVVGQLIDDLTTRKDLAP
jgi:hypothetical protein